MNPIHALERGQMTVLDFEPKLAAVRRATRLTSAECVFVDDLTFNLAGTQAIGMTGIHHTS